MSKLLYSKNPLVINPELAELVGLNEAIILQQLHYWLERSSFSFNGRKWVYNSIEKWHKQFPFISESTIKRVFSNLKKMGIVLIEKLSKDKRDKTNYYSINYGKLEEILKEKSSEIDERCIGSDWSNASGQIYPMEEVKMSQCIIDTEITTEITTETTNKKKKNKQKKKSDDDFELEEIAKEFEIDTELLKDFIAYRKKIKKQVRTQKVLVAFAKEKKKNKQKKKSDDDFELEEIAKEFEIDTELLKDFIAYRKKIKKQVRTQKALVAFAKELKIIKEAGIDLSKAIELMQEREWQSIKLEWVKKFLKTVPSLNQVAQQQYEVSKDW